MREVVGNLVSVNLKWKVFAYHNNLYMPSNFGDGVFCKSYGCSFGTTSSTKMNRSVARICGINLTSTSMNGYSWFGCVQMKLTELSLHCGSIKMGNSLATLNSVAGNESGFVSEENEETDVIHGGNGELELDSSGHYSPPWGNLIVHRRPNSDSESTLQPVVISTNTDTFDEIRVHLLKETDEEELSRRILILSRSNKVRSALELFRSMEFSELQPNVHACNSLVSCLLRNKQLNHAMKVFQFMKRNEILTGHTYTLILRTVADMEGFDSSLNFFADLGGFSPEKNDFDVIVYNTMISVCGRENNWVETQRIWRCMKEKGHHGTQVTYSLLISIFVRCGQNELALDAYREMDQNGIRPRDDTLHAVIGACTKEGEWELGLKIFQNMLNHELKPNLIACNAMMNSLGKAGEYKLAFKVFKIAESLGHTPDTYTWNALLNGLYRANQLVDALQLFEKIKREKSSQINEHLYNTALLCCQKLGLWDKALQLLWQLEASELPVSTTSYNLVIVACEVARKPEVALQVYERMAHQQCPPDTFTYLSLIRSCIWASLWREVEEILEQVAPDVSLYNAVIQGMCLRGKVDSAKKLYMKMRRRGLKPDGKTRSLMLQNLRKVSTKRNRFFARRRL